MLLLPLLKASRLLVCLTLLPAGRPGHLSHGARGGRGFGGRREGHQAQQEGGRRVPEPELRRGAQAAQERRRDLQPVGPREPPGHRAHVRPPRHRDLHGLQAEGRGDQAVPQGAGDPGGHQAGQDPRHAGGAGGLRRGGRAAEGRPRGDQEAAHRAEAGGRGHRPRPGHAVAAGIADHHQGERRFQPGREEGRAVVQRRRRRRLRRAGDEGGPAGSGTYIAEIPASATQGGVVDYFIEALGDNDTALAAKGSDEQDAEDRDAGAERTAVGPASRKGKKPPEKPARDESAEPVLRAGLRQRRRLDDGQGRGQREDKWSIRRASRCRGCCTSRPRSATTSPPSCCCRCSSASSSSPAPRRTTRV